MRAGLQRNLGVAAEGLRAVTGLETADFCCPLCARLLPSDCASVAHAPAKEVGGRPRAFLCKACNNFLGTAYESSADAMIEAARQAGAGVSTTRASATAPGGATIY